MDAAELDLEDLPPKALRKLIKSMLAKAGKRPAGKDADKSADKADEEREALSDLHAEHTGKPSPVPVTEDDLPFDLDNQSESDDSSDEQDGDDSTADAEKPSKKKGK